MMTTKMSGKDSHPKIDGWAIRQPPGIIEDQKYMHPELRNLINGCVLTGYVSGHTRLPDGPITTSRLVSIDVKKNVAQTNNTTYALGDPDPAFLVWLKSQGKTITSLVGEVG